MPISIIASAVHGKVDTKVCTKLLSINNAGGKYFRVPIDSAELLAF